MPSTKLAELRELASRGAPARNPMRQTFAACYANAVNGQIVIVPLNTAMNSRRLIRSPRRRGRARTGAPTNPAPLLSSS